MDNLPTKQVFAPAFHTVPGLVTLASLVAPGAALFAQQAVDLTPCELCIAQRWPYVAVIALGVGTRLVGGKRTEGWLLLAMSLALLVDASIALFHVGVEQHWWAMPTACEVHRLPGGALPDLPSPRCDEPQWSMLGVTMAGYNAGVALTLSLVAMFGAFLRLAESRRATATKQVAAPSPRPERGDSVAPELI